MAKKEKIPKWFPVRPIKPKDTFVSSEYHCPPFVPSYEKDKVNMFLLMAHDYAKLWKLENKVIEKKRFEFAGEEQERLCRRYVLRALQNKRKVAETKPRFIMKRFQNIPSKVRQYMHPGEALQVKEQHGEARSRSEPEFKDACPKHSFSKTKIACAKDSKDLLLEKQKNSDHRGCCNTAEVTISPELMRCKSEMEIVSSSSAITNLLDLGSSKKGSKMSEMCRAHNHYHVAFDGSDVHVREMPPGHRHPFKINAQPH